MTTDNVFSKVISQLQKTPQNQRTSQLIDSIATQMQQSSSPQIQQLGQELEGVKTQLVQACQQS